MLPPPLASLSCAEWTLVSLTSLPVEDIGLRVQGAECKPRVSSLPVIARKRRAGEKIALPPGFPLLPGSVNDLGIKESRFKAH